MGLDLGLRGPDLGLGLDNTVIRNRLVLAIKKTVVVNMELIFLNIESFIGHKIDTW